MIPRSDPAQLKSTALVELARHPFRPAWWLRGGRRQTLLSAVYPRASAQLSLERWPTPDGDVIRVHSSAGNVDRPVMVTLHGLEGSAASTYVGWLARLAEQRRWQLVVPEHRSCGGEMNRARRTYHIGETSDLAFVVDTLRRRSPGRAIFVVGLSLGGNMVLKWLGERPEAVPAEVVAAAAISPPFDLPVSARHVDRALGGAMARVYLKTMIPKAVAKAQQYPGVIDVAAAQRSRSFQEFDDAVTAPLHGFRDAEHYWHDSNCGRFLSTIRTPTLLIASRDDPLNPHTTIPHDVVARSPFLVPLWTRRGGHGAFVTGDLPWRAGRWAEEQVVRFFALCEGG